MPIYQLEEEFGRNESNKYLSKLKKSIMVVSGKATGKCVAD